jgi:hypothetical protein
LVNTRKARLCKSSYFDSGFEALIQPANLTRHERFDSVGVSARQRGIDGIAFLTLCECSACKEGHKNFIYHFT